MRLLRSGIVSGLPGRPLHSREDTSHTSRGDFCGQTKRGRVSAGPPGFVVRQLWVELLHFAPLRDPPYIGIWHCEQDRWCFVR
ncbi:hypothetical protein V7x_24520 [Crateriforma conspicua]|uniref:Uncharacterized protein n=1 Tax=Crateriforma conspicua TaxID=2527996 RepID=A0A5C6FWQ3_9PLAN|nr:hypothetical protein V7x_24520 [Crateriforma conspicua]